VAGFLRDNPDVLKDIQDQDKWLEYSRELDLYTARFRHESSFLDYAKSILDAMKVPTPNLSEKDTDKYLREGHNSDFTKKQLQNMRREPMTSEKIDSLLDKTERRMNEKRESEVVKADEEGRTRSQKQVHFFVALEMYSEFIRNWLSALKESISNIQEDLANDKSGGMPTAIRVPLNSKRQPVEDEDWGKLIGFVESIVKYALPSILSQVAYQNLGSEKLVDFIDEIIGDDSSENLRKLFCSFILLELSPVRAIDRLSKLVDSNKFDRWFLTVVTQRLYSYYATRPLPKSLASKFEGLVADIELQLSGKPERKRNKGLFLKELKKRAYREGVAGKSEAVPD
jgi:hypothetical protein